MRIGDWALALHPQIFVFFEGRVGETLELFRQLAFPLDSFPGGLEQRPGA